MSETVQVRSAWASKINWTQAISFLAMMLTMFGIDLDPETQAQILAFIMALSNVLTWIFKTFFSTTITPGSAALVK